MCGIAGYISVNKKIEINDIKRMINTMIHRGPDDEGIWINQKANIGLGHRRLSIIDLSDKGKQPMHINKRYTITFNGEIYNYIELRNELENEGIIFNTQTDTEVLLHLFVRYKEKCLDLLDGMFAFAIWDEKEQELFCARDRFGEKPFYYYSDADKFMFASEMKALWAAGVEKKIKAERWQNFLLYNQVRDLNEVNSTFYQNIFELLPAHYLKIRLDKLNYIAQQRYWDINYNYINNRISFDEAIANFKDLLTKSVKLRLRSDVPVGSSLSGGLDSSTLVLLINKLYNGLNQHTFSARFKNFNRDEGEFIEAVVQVCKNICNHYVWVEKEQFLEDIDKLCYHQEEPFQSTSVFAQWKIMELAKKHGIKVLIDGQGADEYLAGYIGYYGIYLNQLFYYRYRQFKKEYRIYKQIHSNYTSEDNLFKIGKTRQKLGKFKRIILNQAFPVSKNELNHKLYLDTMGISFSPLQNLLRYADRNSMAHSREVRLPFLSHKLVEFVFSLPAEFKISNGWNKYILRKSMENVLPDKVCWRADKVGFETPQSRWFSEITNDCNLLNLLKDLKLDNFQFNMNDKDAFFRLFVVNKMLKNV